MRRVLVVAAACGGCALVTDLGSLAGDGGAPDASSDAASDGATEASPYFCLDASHTFCDTFDRPPPAEQGWTSSSSNQGTLSLFPDAAVSQPSSLAAFVLPDAGTAYLAELLPTASTFVHVGIDVNLEGSTNGSGPEVDLVQLQWSVPPLGPDGGACTAYGFFVVRDSTGPVVLQETYAGCASNKNHTFPLFGMSFHHVDVDVTFAAPGSVMVKFDGTPLQGFPIVPVVPPSTSTLSLRVGALGSRSLPSPWTLLYDNVVVDVQ